MRYQGRELRQDPYDFFLDVRPESDGRPGLGVDRLIPGRLVPAGRVRSRCSGPTARPGRLMDGEFVWALFDIGEVPQSWYDGTGVPKSGPDKAIIEVTYKSVYGERWRVSSDSVVPQPL